MAILKFKPFLKNQSPDARGIPAMNARGLLAQRAHRPVL